ncbi:MAG: hypothetical protein CMH57_10940 [Myxococcales bacterium]|nr:hypothetical protein [Myxococcales bacterium]
MTDAQADDPATAPSPPNQAQAAPAKFGTFTGVFTPTLLTILGVIMYVRLGWVVGNAGLYGAFLVLLLALGISAATALSLSSIATNTRLGAGGPFALISRALGLEVGGSIGVPLYLSRPLGVAMYIFGFREGWLWIFPDHPALSVDLAVFGVLFGLAYVSANLAFRVQYLIMAIIVASLVSILLAPAVWQEPLSPTYWGAYPGFPEEGFQGVDFWVVFAVFFPATTGILAGANMSGDLKDPRRAIPQGTLWAIGLSTVIYFVLAYYAALMAPPEELVSNYNVLIDGALWPPAVLAGLLGATFSSALAGAVGGPRILMAMGQRGLLPQSDWLARTKGGEPRNAITVTAVLTLAALMVRDLNAIASLVTMFFLITYFAINLILLIESSLGLVSFRPTLRVPRLVPLLGAVGCVFVMFIISPTFGLIAVGLVVAIYVWILRKGLQQDGVEDVRSGIFGAMAEWAAAQVTEMPSGEQRAWKPNFLVPVEDTDELRGEFLFIHDMCHPEGSVKLMGLSHDRDQDVLRREILALSDSFRAKGLFSTWCVVNDVGFTNGVIHGLQALQSAFFRPNTLYLRVPDLKDRYDEFKEVIIQAHETGVGVVLLGRHPKSGMGQLKEINVWVRPARSGWGTQDAFEHNNLNLILLMGYRLMVRWQANMRLITVIGDESERPQAEAFLADLLDLARIPKPADSLVLVGGFQACLASAPRSDIDILGLQQEPDFDFVAGAVELTRSTCLFVMDSGRESALV